MMEAATTDVIVAWTARISIACYLTAAVAAILRKRKSGRWEISVGFYAAGWAWMVVHVAAAFEFVHGWSHTAAYEHTARRTAEVIGLDWGGGVYFNYSMLLIWGADVFRRFFVSKARYESPGGWGIFVQAYLIFMIVNATVVFGPPGWIWTACGLGLVASLVAVLKLRSSST